MVDKYGTGQDPYCYSGTNVLINKFNIKNETTLNDAEREITTAALQNISFQVAPYDLNYFKRLHFILFNHIYDWAGEIRTIDISKENTRFCTSSRIEPEANKIFEDLKQKNYYQDCSHEIFIENLAELYADINMLHPFRDGNGRTQRILFEHIALNCNYIIDWGAVTTEKWIIANIHGANCNFKPLGEIFKGALKLATI